MHSVNCQMERIRMKYISLISLKFQIFNNYVPGFGWQVYDFKEAICDIQLIKLQKKNKFCSVQN